MRSCTLIVGLLASLALASPLVADRRDAELVTVGNNVYHYATLVVTVTPTPVDSAPVEEYSYTRHRHTKLRQGSPAAPVYGDVLPTLESFPVLTAFASPFKKVQVDTPATSVSKVEISEVVTSEAAPSTPTSILSASSQSQGEEVFTIEPALVTTFSASSTSSQVQSEEIFTIETAPPTALSTSSATSTPPTVLSTSSASSQTQSDEVSNIVTASSTSLSTSSSRIQSEQAPSTTNALASSQTSADQALPSTFVPNLDPTSAIYKGLVLEHHNIHRRNHSAEDLTWDDTLAEYAETTAKTCIWAHSLVPGGGGYGQNIAAGPQAGNITTILTEIFYNGELPFYPQFGTDTPDPTLFEKWGHFSQMVWNTTTTVGCYTTICSPPGESILDCKPDGTSYLSGLDCGNGGIPAVFTVCNYVPAGNFAGQYTKVGAPLNHPRVFVNGDGVQGL